MWIRGRERNQGLEMGKESRKQREKARKGRETTEL